MKKWHLTRELAQSKSARKLIEKLQRDIPRMAYTPELEFITADWETPEAPEYPVEHDSTDPNDPGAGFTFCTKEESAHARVYDVYVHKWTRWSYTRDFNFNYHHKNDCQFRKPISMPSATSKFTWDAGEGFVPCEPKEATECRLYGDWKPVAERECAPVHHFQWRKPVGQTRI